MTSIAARAITPGHYDAACSSADLSVPKSKRLRQRAFDRPAFGEILHGSDDTPEGTIRIEHRAPFDDVHTLLAVRVADPDLDRSTLPSGPQARPSFYQQLGIGGIYPA